MNTTSRPLPESPIYWQAQAFEYTRDFFERSVLFADIIRRRGNQYLDHLRRGLPSVGGRDSSTRVRALNGRRVAGCKEERQDEGQNTHR